MAEGLKAVTSDSVSAEVTITGISASDKIEIDTVSGGADLKNIKTEKLDIDTVSGSIKAAGEFTELESDSVSGDLEVNPDGFCSSVGSFTCKGFFGSVFTLNVYGLCA